MPQQCAKKSCNVAGWTPISFWLSIQNFWFQFFCLVFLDRNSPSAHCSVRPHLVAKRELFVCVAWISWFRTHNASLELCLFMTSFELSCAPYTKFCFMIAEKPLGARKLCCWTFCHGHALNVVRHWGKNNVGMQNSINQNLAKLFMFYVYVCVCVLSTNIRTHTYTHAKRWRLGKHKENLWVFVYFPGKILEVYMVCNPFAASANCSFSHTCRLFLWQQNTEMWRKIWEKHKRS